MTKEKFIEYIEIQKKFFDKAQEIYDSTRGAITLYNIEELDSLISGYTELLSLVTKDTGKDIDYFCCECEYGKDPQKISWGDRTWELKSFEDLWNYLVEMHPEIVDK